ncbi:hypothetical protein PLESTF_000514900 [Pleodorina starrii]|nr:hypothetical protein PLESTF_000514900 [Pleodorina starrii]
MHQTASEPPLDHQVGHLRSQGRHQAAAELLAADAAEWRTLVAVAGCMPQLSSLRTHARANLADLGALRSLTSLIVGAGIALPEAAESGGEVAPAGGPPATAGLPAAQCAPMYPLPPQLEMMLVDDPCRCPSLLLRSSGSSRPPLPAQLLQQHLAPSAFTPFLKRCSPLRHVAPALHASTDRHRYRTGLPHSWLGPLASELRPPSLELSGLALTPHDMLSLGRHAPWLKVCGLGGPVGG